MKYNLILLFLCASSILLAQNKKYADFKEFTLKNGLHVIMHKDVNEPNVIIGTKYHVGAKNEEASRTGFAHFFEHLLFHGSKNIPQGEYENIVSAAGGYCNAYTTYDVTYYYQLLPAHEYKLGLWLESERMLHPTIIEEGINREREIVKEEKRMRYDSKPLGNAYFDLMGKLFSFETYGHNIIGSMEHLNASSIQDFESFFNTYYSPNNACLVISGNIDYKQTKKWVHYYFEDIPKGKAVKRPTQFVNTHLEQKHFDMSMDGLKKESVLMGYPAMPDTHEDAAAFRLLTSILSGNSDYSYFENEVMLQKDTIISNLSATAELYENVGALHIKANLNHPDQLDYVVRKTEAQLNRLKNDLVNPVLLQKVINEFEVAYVDYFFHAESFADRISRYHHLYGSASKMNDMIEAFKAVSPEDIRRVARKYLKHDQHVTIVYHPKNDQ